MALTAEAVMNNLMAYPEVAAVGFVAGFLTRLFMKRNKKRSGGGNW
ncbi:hypothetical protein [Candidatus Nanohalovita haloferacivicina]|nr:hypothetical protein HBNXNv_1088 [Candidatus Nanohalobia archaeon BNXNv]